MEIKIIKADLIGELENFPIKVVEKMLQRQYEQVGKIDISIFQKYNRSDIQKGGFHWADTIEGHGFWYGVIVEEKFNMFFTRYPELSKNVYIRGDVLNGKNVIKELESRGGINKFDYSGTANALYFIDPVTNYITMASKVEESFQNLLKTCYTEITLEKVVELTIEEVAEKLGVNVELLRIKK